jgi:hypothetical protein
MISTFLIYGLLLLVTQVSFTQVKVNRKPPSQPNTTEQEKAMQDFQLAVDPEALIKQLDQQLNNLKKQGLATPELIREIEKAKEEIRKEFGGLPKAEPASDKPKPGEERNNPLEHAGSTEQEVAYDLQPNPVSEVPLFVQFYEESAMTTPKFQEWMSQRYGVNLRFTDSLHKDKGLSCRR